MTTPAHTCHSPVSTHSHRPFAPPGRTRGPLGTCLARRLLGLGSTAAILLSSALCAQSIRQVAEIRSGSNGSFPSQLVDLNGQVFFEANNGVTGYEVMYSNGTAAGTRLLLDAYPGSLNGNPWSLSAHGDTLAYGTYTAAGTVALILRNGSTIRTLNWPGFMVNDPVAVLNGKALFRAVGGTSRFLYVTDGTAAGTQRLVVPGAIGETSCVFCSSRGL